MNSFPNPYIKEMYDSNTGECIKMWFCSKRLANLIIRKLNRVEWHRVYISIKATHWGRFHWGSFRSRMISLDGMIVMVKDKNYAIQWKMS